MIALAVALGLAAAPEATDFTTRMRDSAAAAEALQGPLDGTWTLRDAQRRPLFVFQITDPVGGGPLEGAWRRPGASAPVVLIDEIERRGDRLAIRFAGDGEVVRVSLRRRGDGAWTGQANENGREFLVSLRRPAPAATPR